MAGTPIDWDHVIRLYERPDQWQDVHGEDLTNLILCGCLKYAATLDQSRIPPLKGLYERFVSETTTEQRKDLFTWLDTAVVDGLGSAYAFMPLIYAEPTVGLISSASLSLAQLHPIIRAIPTRSRSRAALPGERFK